MRGELRGEALRKRVEEDANRLLHRPWQDEWRKRVEREHRKGDLDNRWNPFVLADLGEGPRIHGLEAYTGEGVTCHMRLSGTNPDEVLYQAWLMTPQLWGDE